VQRQRLAKVEGPQDLKGSPMVVVAIRRKASESSLNPFSLEPQKTTMTEPDYLNMRHANQKVISHPPLAACLSQNHPLLHPSYPAPVGGTAKYSGIFTTGRRVCDRKRFV
jgi:hypothetical protein